MSQRFGIGNVGGRAVLVMQGRMVDLEQASEGRLPSDPMAAVQQAQAIAAFGQTLSVPADAPTFELTAALAPVPTPGQVFAIGLNYKDHAAEAQLPLPDAPMVFTKFPSCIAGPAVDIPLSSDTVDYEVELVVVVAQGGRNISVADALSHVAGYCVGQDISDRRRQFSDKPPQFSLGKSARHFGPIGPFWTPLSSIEAPLDLAITCHVNGVPMQESRTSQMVFDVPTLIAFLSSHCELRPGDLIFTGTPSGVGAVRNPRQYLKAGDIIDSEIEGLGRTRHRCV